MTTSTNNTWKKYITPGVIVVIIMGLVGFIANSFSEELKEKADNKTLQMYIMQQEKKDIQSIQDRKDQRQLQQKSIDDKFMMQQRNIEQLINVLKDK